MTAHIDKAVEEIERRREAAGRGVEYKAFENVFHAGHGLCGNRRGTGYRKEHTEALGYGHHKRAVSIIVGIDEERVKVSV